jgi:hypothetical protein
MEITKDILTEKYIPRAWGFYMASDYSKEAMEFLQKEVDMDPDQCAINLDPGEIDFLPWEPMENRFVHDLLEDIYHLAESFAELEQEVEAEVLQRLL